MTNQREKQEQSESQKRKNSEISGKVSEELENVLTFQIDLKESIDGLSAQEACDFLMDNFSLKDIHELSSKYGIQKLQFMNKIFYTENMDFNNLKNLTKEEFELMLNQCNEEEKRALLNNVYAGVNGGTYIIMYNHNYIMELQSVKHGKSLQESELEYFEGIERNLIPDLYKKSTLSHEVAHSIFHQEIENTELFEERLEIIAKYGSLTKYAEMYNNGDNMDNEERTLYLNENFAEAIRIYSVNPEYLKKKFPKGFDFIQNYFPHILPIESKGKL